MTQDGSGEAHEARCGLSDWCDLRERMVDISDHYLLESLSSRQHDFKCLITPTHQTPPPQQPLAAHRAADPPAATASSVSASGCQ
ncbi:hypothetical protein E2C01_083936 [Portunus trituberculatus]|uniref:Uncharacterized protein n=1 Tax=Portunus trituberculatus TaxID=210409 RepID=A0A5B7J7V8_PORTR|nr:hypothetical protein [Portunus trituberculatus]